MSLTAIALVLVLLVLAGAAYFHYASQASPESTSKSKSAANSEGSGDQGNASVATTSDGKSVRIQIDDLIKVFNNLTPESKHWDILFAIITSSEIVSVVTQALDAVEEIRQKKLKKKQEEEAKKKDDVVSFDDLFDQDGFDEGDEDEDDDEDTREAKRKAKEEEARKKADMDRLKQATGQKLPLLEDMDEGVLGQEWVEKTLQAKGAWPLQLPGWLKKAKFDWKGKSMSAMDHPAVRRILCMTAGRMNSAMLNSHKELMEASQRKLLDSTYFGGTPDFRQRIVIHLEACMRVSMILKSYRLFGSMVETMSCFKIGCQPDALPWFNGIMARQYDTLPRISVGKTAMESEDESNQDNLVAGGQGLFSIAVDRLHTEKFVKVKVAQAQSRGIPPQVALQASRESWWFLLRCERLDGPTPKVEPIEMENSAVVKGLAPQALKAYTNEAEELKLQTVWPMIIQNIAQKAGTVKVKVKLPSEPGKYRFTCAIKSADFLGADQEVSVDVDVQDGPVSEATEEDVKKDQ